MDKMAIRDTPSGADPGVGKGRGIRG